MSERHEYDDDRQQPFAAENRDGAHFVEIARFPSAAEAGFFAHELQTSEQIRSRVMAENEFDAVRPGLSCRFLLSVAASDADCALTALDHWINSADSAHLDEAHEGLLSQIRQPLDEGTLMDVSRSRGSRWSWVVFLLIVAGLAGLLALKTGRARQPKAHAEPVMENRIQ